MGIRRGRVPSRKMRTCKQGLHQGPSRDGVWEAKSDGRASLDGRFRRGRAPPYMSMDVPPGRRPPFRSRIGVTVASPSPRPASAPRPPHSAADSAQVLPTAGVGGAGDTASGEVASSPWCGGVGGHFGCWMGPSRWQGRHARWLYVHTAVLLIIEAVDRGKERMKGAGAGGTY